MNNKNLVDKNKDFIFSKLISISEMPDYTYLKNSNYQKLSENYKTSLKQLQKGNKNFLQKFNTLYSNARYSDALEYLDKLDDKPKSTPKKKLKTSKN